MDAVNPPGVSMGAEPFLTIATLGRFDIYLDQTPITFSRKTPHKPLDLLKGLLVMGGRGISRRVLCDSLWPDLDGWLAGQALNAALFRLRGILRSKASVQVKGDLVSLDNTRCRIDAWEFENRPLQTRDTKMMTESLFSYRGPFLGDSEHPLAFAARERLRRKFSRGVLQLGQQLQREGSPSAALDVFQRALDVDVGLDDVRQALLEGLQHRGPRIDRGAMAHAAF